MMRVAPPLPAQAGRVVPVANETQLRDAVTGAKNGDIITLADGTYRIVPFMWLKDKKNVTIRSASGDPSKVILRGKGWDQGGDHDNEDILWIDSSENITIAQITFAETHAYGLKINADGGPKNINVYNCYFRDIGIRGIKGTKGDSGKMVSGGSVRYCFFENTKIPPSNWQFDGDYITSIDMMKLDGWTFADNVFKDIKGHNGQARGAIFVWVESKNITVERNLFLNCDRSVCFGNPSNTNPNVTDGVCRNNFFCMTSDDAAIELTGVSNVKVYHNTIVKKDPLSRGVRVVSDSSGKGIEIVNNILSGSLELHGATESNNYSGATAGYFADPAKGDLRLTAAAVGAIKKGVAIKDVKDDFNGAHRGPQPDIGASEFGASHATSATADATSAGSVVKPASGGDPKSSPAAASIDSKSLRETIMAALQSSKATPNVKAYVVIFGQAQNVRFKGADADGIWVDLDGNKLPIRWRELTDADYVSLALAALPDDPGMLYCAGGLAASAKLDEKYKKIFDQLVARDLPRAQQLTQLTGRH